MIEPRRKSSHADSPADALAISMQEVGRVELDYMKDLTGRTEEELVKALEFDRIYFDFQKREYQLAEEYLSGDVRAKIEFTETQIKQTESKMNEKLASAILRLGDVKPYEPKNEIEEKILESNSNRDSVFSFATFYDAKEGTYYDDYILSQKDNRELMVQVALRHGIANSRDRIAEFLADKPLIALEAIRLGREVGYSKQADLLILSYLRTIDESFTRTDVEHDLMLYDFLKKQLANFEGDMTAFREQVDNYYQRSSDSSIKAEWEQYKADYQRQKAVESDRVNPDCKLMNWLTQSTKCNANIARNFLSNKLNWKKNLLERLEALQNDKTDDTITFEQLGVDRLYVDEAHYYKNLFTYTKMQNIPGISTTDAKKTTDMYEKCRYLNEINGGRCGIVFASGTPVSNSM